MPEALEELVRGVKVIEYDRGEQKEIVYRKEPNIQAIKLLLDRTYGKQETKVEHSGAVEVVGSLELNIPDDEMLSGLEVAAQDIKRKMSKDDNFIEGEMRELLPEESSLEEQEE